MPTISTFYGIIIKMFFIFKEHNPPHIHAIYGEYMGEFIIETGEMVIGDLPPKAQKLVKEWIMINKADLIEIWDTQQFKTLPPLL